jgi:hypothetical protein
LEGFGLDNFQTRKQHTVVVYEAENDRNYQIGQDVAQQIDFERVLQKNNFPLSRWTGRLV